MTFTATVGVQAPGIGIPTGVVTFTEGATTLGAGTLTGGIVTFSTSSLSVGTHAIIAEYGGAADFANSTSSATDQVVKGASTTTTLAASPNPSVFGQSVTFTATIGVQAPGIGTPTGVVTFTHDGAFLGAGPLAGGVATFSTGSLSLGTHSITAEYGGDANFANSTSSATDQVVNQAGTTTTLIFSPNPSVFGQSVTFTATVGVQAPGIGTPTGVVTFTEGATTLGSGTLAGGIATFSTTSLSVGTHAITAQYGADTNFAASTSPATDQVVNKASTTTTLISSPNPSVFGQSVTFTVTVGVQAPGAGTPTGVVTFTEGAVTLGSGPLNGVGVATFSSSSLSLGTHVVTAEYGGDTSYATSTSPATDQVVNKANTTTTLTSSLNPSVIGQSVTFTATVGVQAPGIGTPTGVVTFTEGAATLGAGVLSSGIVTFSTSSLSVGTHAIIAEYGGDADFANSTSSATDQVVKGASTTTTLAASPNPSVFSQSVTFTATVQVSGIGTPTGVVTFAEGAATLGTGVLTGGIATFSTSSLSAGTHAITAEYGGDMSYAGSTSPATDQVVNQAGTTTALDASPNPSVFGQSVTFTATVGVQAPSIGTPTGVITFAEGATTLGTGTLAGGIATFSTGSLSVGTHTITAVYGGNINFAGSTSNGLILTINKADQTITFDALSDKQYGVDSFAVTATASSGLDVSFTSLTSSICTVSDDAVSLNDGGTCIIRASQPGDGSYNAAVDVDRSFAVTCANTITVNTVADSGYRTLRDAVANICDGGTVNFGPSLNSQTIILTSGEIVINKNLTIDGPGAGNLTVSGNHASRIFDIGGGVTIQELTLQDGNAGTGNGGAILTTSSLTLTAVSFYTNTANLGGAVFNDAGNMTIAGSIFVQNTSVFSGGALFNDAGQTAIANSAFTDNNTSTADGGAIFNSDATTSTLIVDGSTFNGNRAFKGGAIQSHKVLHLSNSTFHNNTATDAAGGGGALRLMDTVYITNTTIYSNGAPGNGGGVRIASPTGSFSFVNVIIAGNSGGACSTAGGGFVGSTNLATDNTCGANFTQVDDVLLGAFGNYGGDTETVPLLPGSSAIDSGSASACPATDQRGVGRVKACDIGAFESQGFTLTKTGGYYQSTAWGTPFPDPLALSVVSSQSEPVDGGHVTFAGPLIGPSTVPVSLTATIASGAVSVNMTANNTIGKYLVTAGARGALPVAYSLTNAKYATTTNLQSGLNPSSHGQLVTFTATVKVVGAELTAQGSGPNGQVRFSSQSGELATVNLVGGVATLAIDNLVIGSHTITAKFLGDSLFSVSTSNSVQQVVNMYGTTTSLATASNPSKVGEIVVLTATVAKQLGAATVAPAHPSGQVKFRKHDGTVLGIANLVAGVAVLAKNDLPVGTHTLLAEYLGDAVHIGSTSNLVNQIVQPLPLPRMTPAEHFRARPSPSIRWPTISTRLDMASPSSLSAKPTNGAVVIDAGAKSVTYTSAPAFSGVDSFTYTIRDGNGNTDQAKVAVVVTNSGETDGPPQIGVVDNGTGSTLNFTNGSFDVLFQAPAGSYSGTLESKDIFYLAYTRVVTPTGNVNLEPHGFKFGNIVFAVSAYLNGEKLEHYQFPYPITVIVDYDPVLLGDLHEETLVALLLDRH